MKYAADYHIHTHHSGDSNAPMEDMIKKAIELGLKGMCFTDHLDLDYPDYPDLPPSPFTLDIPAYRSEFMHFKELYRDRIDLKFGIEVGMQEHVAKENSRIVSENDFDFVIASIHLLFGEDPYYEVFWTARNIEDIYRSYFEKTLENITLFTDFDVLGHLDYISRYVVPKDDKTYSYQRFAKEIDAILSYLAVNEKGLDINSKVLSADPGGTPNPCPDVIRRFKELGGRIITFGSDAHAPGGIAAGFDRLRDIALSCGFTEYYTFDKRTPIPHTL